MANKSIHLVLSSGGVRTLSYIGAIMALQQFDIEIKSISCCSAGSLWGALLATGADFKIIEPQMYKKRLVYYVGKKKFPGLLSILTFLKYPFAKYEHGKLSELYVELSDGDRPLKDLKIPFSTMGIDIINDRYLVFSAETHPEMPVSEALNIATAIPGHYPPYERDNRVIIDAAIATSSPVWLAAALQDGNPIVVLRPQRQEDFMYQKRYDRFLGEAIKAGIESRDWYMLQADPSIRLVEINCDNIPFDNFDLPNRKIARLIQNGKNAMEERLPWLWTSQPEQLERKVLITADDLGEQRATELINKYRGVLRQKRNQVFISCSEADSVWSDRLDVFLKPLRHHTGLQVWGDKNLETGVDVPAAINNNLETTKVAVLLISAAYFETEYDSPEIKRVMEDAKNNIVKVLWVLIGECDYGLSDIANYPAAFPPRKSLHSMTDAEQESALKAIVERIKNVMIE